MNVNRITTYAFSKSKVLKEVVTNPSNEYLKFHLERVSKQEHHNPLEINMHTGIQNIIDAGRDYWLSREINMVMGGNPSLNILI